MYIRGRQWYYFIKSEADRPDSTGKGLLDDYSQQNLSSMLVCCMEHPRDGRKLYTVFDSYLDLGMAMKDVAPEVRHFHEVIFGQGYQKPHFDIDVEPRPSDEVAQRFLDQLISAIQEIFDLWPSLKFSLRKHVIVCSSHGATKLSYHIIIDGFIHTSYQEAEDFCYLVRSKLSPEFQGWLDVGIYTKLHQLRVVTSVKRDTARVKEFQTAWQFKDRTVEFEYLMPPENDDHAQMMQLQSSLVTYISGCRSLPTIRDAVPESVHLLPYRRPATENYHEISDETAKAAIRLLAELAETTPSSRNFPYRYQTTRGGLILLQRLRPSHCRICERRHRSENPYLIVTAKHQVYFCCRRNKDGRRLYVGDLGTSEFTVPELPTSGLPITEVQMATFGLPVPETVTLKTESCELPKESPLDYMNIVQSRTKREPKPKPITGLSAVGLIDPDFMY